MENYDNFGYPIAARSGMLATMSRLVENVESESISQSQAETSLWTLAAHYTQGPEQSIELYKEMIVMCFPATGIYGELYEMAKAGRGKIPMIKHLREHRRSYGGDDSLRGCKEYIEVNFPQVVRLSDPR